MATSTTEIDRLVQLLSKLPGLGPRSARRAALDMLKRKETILTPLAEALRSAAEGVSTCSVCGNLDASNPCSVCADDRRDQSTLCIVEDVADMWALERSGVYKGQYHILGGTLSALDGVGPEELSIGAMISRSEDDRVAEVILAMNATVEGQTTAHYVTDRLAGTGVRISRLAHGMPMGGELDYLDEGTLAWALKSRQTVTGT
jgi:recombination protein RecR